MVNRDLIPHLKASCVALGIFDPNTPDPNIPPIPKMITGTGFLVRKDGWLATAAHVLSDLENQCKKFHQEGQSAEIGFFYYPSNKSYAIVGPIKTIMTSQQLLPHTTETTLPFDLDIGYAKIDGEYDSEYTILEVSKPDPMNVFDEVWMCGYPGGMQSFDIERKFGGQRFNPVMQSGRIGALLPIDAGDYHYGIQTDIIATGGSSGSPLINPNTGQVLGIAQNVILGDVQVDIGVRNKTEIYTGKGFGKAKIGLVYGISSEMFYQEIPKLNEIAAGKSIPSSINTSTLKTFKIS